MGIYCRKEKHFISAHHAIHAKNTLFYILFNCNVHLRAGVLLLNLLQHFEFSMVQY